MVVLACGNPSHNLEVVSTPKSDHNYPVPDHEYFQLVWALCLQMLPSWSALLSQSNMLLTFMLYRLYPRHQQPPVFLSFSSHLYGSSLWDVILRDLFQSLSILGDCYSASFFLDLCVTPQLCL